MSLTSLQDDLLRDFKDQKEMIYQQITLFDPLGTRLRQPAAQRLVGKGALIFSEILCYSLSAGTIALGVFLNKVHPFYILSELRYKTEYRTLGWMNIEAFNIAIYTMIGLIALLFYILARVMRHLRLKNDILHFAGKQIKELVGEHLKRKAAIEAIEQRHFTELPGLSVKYPTSNNSIWSNEDQLL
ncbi:MAG: hypothetical protein EOP51_14830 [Sphingobacteriales bacterium]|nr:MAG: hypothetical protein EOP51_14830 [Sphingobacteriales bacterium]